MKKNYDEIIPIYSNYDDDEKIFKLLKQAEKEFIEKLHLSKYLRHKEKDKT